MHALVTPVLPRLAGLGPLQLEAQLQPPRGQLAEAAGPDRGERAAVVAAQPLRQAVLPEHLLQRSPRGRPRHLPMPRAAQQVAAVRVLQRQPVQPLPVPCAELPRVVDRPRRVRTHWSRRRRRPLGLRSRVRQARPLQDLADRRLRRPVRARLRRRQPRPQLLRTPCRMRPARRRQPPLHLRRNAPRAVPARV